MILILSLLRALGSPGYWAVRLFVVVLSSIMTRDLGILRLIWKTIDLHF